MLDMHHFTATDHQSGSSKTTKVFFKKAVICSQLRSDIQTYRHQPQYTPDTNTAEINVCSQKCQAAASTILYKINWQYVDQVFHVHRIFNSHNGYVWPAASSHTASPHWHQQCFAVKVWVGIVLNFLVGPYYPDRSVHKFTGYLWGKSYQKCGANTTELQLTLLVRYENISHPLTITGLDRAGL
jgi:hypothetical protein